MGDLLAEFDLLAFQPVGPVVAQIGERQFAADRLGAVDEDPPGRAAIEIARTLGADLRQHAGEFELGPRIALANHAAFPCPEQAAQARFAQHLALARLQPAGEGAGDVVAEARHAFPGATSAPQPRRPYRACNAAIPRTTPGTATAPPDAAGRGRNSIPWA